MNNIKVEPAVNQKDVELPSFETYYQAFTRYYGGEWFANISYRDKTVVLDALRLYNKNTEEVKIISIQLPF